VAEPVTCDWGGMGLLDNDPARPLPADRVFAARCECGAYVTVVDGRIPFHRTGEDERPPPETFKVYEPCARGHSPCSRVDPGCVPE